MVKRSRKKKGESRKISKILYSPYTISLLGLIVFVLLIIPLQEKLDQKKKIDKEIAHLKKDIKELENNNESLDKLISYLQSDHFAEKEARLKMGLKKQGEDVLVIKNELGQVKGKISNNEEGNNKEGGQRSNPENWWLYFFGT